MDKEQLLEQVFELASTGSVTREELERAYARGEAAVITPEHRAISRHLTIAEILYYFGGILTFIGVAVMLGENWDVLSAPLRVFATLGFGLITLASGLWLASREKLNGVGQAFTLIGCLTFPVGVYALLDALKINTDGLGTQSIAVGVIAAVFLILYWYFRRLLVLIFAIACATAFYFIFTSFISETADIATTLFFEYQILFAAVSYLLLGYAFAKYLAVSRLSLPLYSFGIIAFLGAGFALSQDNVIWEAIYPLLALGAMLFSTQIRSRAFLIAGAIALISYIFWITGKYFSENVGWSVALIISGFALIGIGYVALFLNKKYFSNKTVSKLE